MDSSQSAEGAPFGQGAVRRHFTLGEANRTLPLVRRIVSDIVEQFAELSRLAERHRVASEGGDTSLAESLQFEWDGVEARLQRLHHELELIGCQLKDPRIGLIDFPSRLTDRDVLLCWKHGEGEIGFWHEMDAGFAGRRPTSALE